MSRRKQLLITGIPGTGKTTIGNYLATERGYIHVDLELPENISEFLADPITFVNRIATGEQNIALTWGFMPHVYAEQVLFLKQSGFTLFWFDGDRTAALREFNRRGTVGEDLFHIQLNNINVTGIIKDIDPIIVNSFDNTGTFRSVESIAQELESKT